MNLLRKGEDGPIQWAEVASWRDGASVWRSVENSFWEERHHPPTLKLMWRYRGRESLLFLHLDGSLQPWFKYTPRQLERLRWLLPELGVALDAELRDLTPTPGRTSLPEEELEIYRLLGEPPPYLWSTRKLLPWLEERTVSREP